MLDVTMDMEQYDCPFIDTSADHDVSFTTVHWHLDTAAAQLETRLLVTAPNQRHLEKSLRSLRDHDNTQAYRLFSKEQGKAVIRTVIEETNAMSTIKAHDGYITGPFHIEAGRETWRVGFDDEETLDETVYDLEKENDFVIEGQSELKHDQLFDLVENAEAASTLLDSCRTLSRVEEDTLTKAAEAGYFDAPRQATLSTLADEFDVSTAAVSKNMRRGEKKILRSVIEALESLDD